MTRSSVERGGKGAAGFLLTETLATFTISAFILLGLVSASSVLVRAVDRAVAHAQDVDDLSRTLKAIARDVSGLARARWDGVEPQPFVFLGGPNSLFFANTHRAANSWSRTYVIALRETVIGQRTHLMRSEGQLSSRAKGFDTLRYSPPRELGTGQTRLRFFYVPAAVGKPLLSVWPTGTVLPAAIIIETFARDTGSTIISMRVPIRANADIGCLEVNGDQSKTTSPSESENPPARFCGRADTTRDDQGNVIAQPGRPSQPTAGPEL